MGRIRTTKQLAPKDQFLDVTRNQKIQMTLVGMADLYDEQARDIIIATYNDRKLMSEYQAIRNSGIYEKGGDFRRKLFEIPNMTVWHFIDTVMKSLYGINWLDEDKAIRHELIRPWLVVKRI